MDPRTPPLRIIVTGGTFDKRYDAIKGELTFEDTHLPDILKQIRVTVPVAVEVNQLIDSLQMQDADRDKVLRSCADAVETRLVVIHGTDTMAQTAAVVGRAALAKTIVFTGAMVPYSVQGSDALFNLGCAFAAAGTLPHGVYVAMNGGVFSWDNVAKDRTQGLFHAAR